MDLISEIKLTQYSHGAGCGCKISPAVLDSILQSALSGTDNMPVVNLQSNIIAFEMRTWNSSENNWRVAGSDLASGNQQGGKAVPPKTGLEVSLQLQGREHPLLKVFLLGAA